MDNYLIEMKNLVNFYVQQSERDFEGGQLYQPTGRFGTAVCGAGVIAICICLMYLYLYLYLCYVMQWVELQTGGRGGGG